MRALKALVIFLGVLIIGGLVVIGLTIYQRTRAPAVGAAAPEVALAGFGTRRINLPQGADIVSAVAEGDRLVLIVVLPQGEQRVIVIDMASGDEIGRIEVEWTE